MNRRELLRLVGVAGSLLVVSETEIDRVCHATHKARYLDHDTVASYEGMNTALWSSFSATPSKRDLLPAARQHLAALNASMREPQRQDVRERLSGVSGDLFQLCGEIFFDSDRYEDAAQCYSLAAHASREAKRCDLGACAMTRHAFVNIYEKQHDHAAALLERAAQIARRGNPEQPARHWVAAVQARTSALLGNVTACERALDHAEEVRSLGTVELSGWLRFDDSRLNEERGSCYITLNRPEDAEPVLHAALRPGLSFRRRGSVLTDLAVAGAQRGDLDQVLMYSAAALDTVRQTASTGYLGRQLIDLRKKLVPHLTNKHIRHLDSQIAVHNPTAKEHNSVR